MSVKQAAEQWSGHCQRFAPGTRQNYQRAIERLFAYCRPSCLADLTAGQLNAYVNSRLAGRKPQTVNKDINAIRSFFRWLAETYEVPNAAAKLRKMPVCDEQGRFLDEAEYRKVLAVAEGRNRALIQFLANTGLRAAELIALTPASLHGEWLTVSGKGRKSRDVPLNAVALQTVHVAIEFTKSRNALYYICIRLAKRAAIRPFGPHSLRHYCATQLLARGVPIQHVSKFLGHTSVAFTEKVYYHFQPSHLAGITDCMDAPSVIAAEQHQPKIIPPASQISELRALFDSLRSGWLAEMKQAAVEVCQKLVAEQREKGRSARIETDWPQVETAGNEYDRSSSGGSWSCVSSMSTEVAAQVRKRAAVLSGIVEVEADRPVDSGLDRKTSARPRQSEKKPLRERRSLSFEDSHRAVNGVEHKFCVTCKLWKPYDDFYRNKKAKDGLQRYCKVCDNAQAVRRQRSKRQREGGARQDGRRTLADNNVERQCTKCLAWRPENEFYRNKSSSGYRSRCKTCYRMTQRKRAHSGQIVPRPERQRIQDGQIELRCTGCLQWKTPDAFYAYAARCKACCQAASSNYHRGKRDNSNSAGAALTAIMAKRRID